MYYFMLAVFVFGFLLICRTVHSPFGQVLKAIRENEPRAISLGYKVDQYKLLAFVLSAALAGLAGATKAIVFQFATLTDVHWHISGEVVLMTLLGGMGTIFGPVAGAFIMVTLQNYLAEFGGWVTVIIGAIFVACVLLFRRGVVGELARLLERRREVASPARSARPEGPLPEDTVRRLRHRPGRARQQCHRRPRARRSQAVPPITRDGLCRARAARRGRHPGRRRGRGGAARRAARRRVTVFNLATEVSTSFRNIYDPATRTPAASGSTR